RGTPWVTLDHLLTPGNVQRITDELAKMRGAAMKIGQMLSMDTGDVLPPELTDILARLRAEADFMPPKQLRQVLDREWGAGWIRQFQSFNVRPIAAASIGQVHRAVLKDGTDLAIKVQYPGVAESIDSDVANVGRLIKMSGLLPQGFEIDPYLAEASAQLQDEADYALEASHLIAFNDLLAGDDRFVLPQHHAPLTTKHVLAMTFVESAPIDAVQDRPQDERDRCASQLLELCLQELLTFGLMQTDPNFANYRYDPLSERVVLLDFGATRAVPDTLARQFRSLFSAGLAGDSAELERVSVEMGFMDADTDERDRGQILNLIDMVFAEVRRDAILDFAATDLSKRLQQAGQVLAESGYVPPPMPLDLLFVQRKIAGIFLLATRIKARVEVRSMLERFVS
ncbi:MAG: AarF/ABC1/UbiB kinase family protein, partial [Pseudomonadota bacterium]